MRSPGPAIILNLEMAARATPKKRTGVEVCVFDYLDFRAYLRAYYEAAKATRAGFSFRTFSKLAGLKSPNFFKLVMDGERNLGPDTVPKFADALGLEGPERSFFADLVAFDQAPNSAEKNRAFERIAASRRFRAARRIDSMLLRYLSHWYHPAVRELVGRCDFVEDPQWIAETLQPHITATQARDSVVLLVELGLLERDPATHRLVQAEPTLTTEHEVQTIGAAQFHREMMKRATDALDTIPPQHRDFAALTVRVSARNVARVKERIHAFRESLAELCDADTEGRSVYQLNIQWFPLSRLDCGEEEK